MILADMSASANDSRVSSLLGRDGESDKRDRGRVRNQLFDNIL